MVLPLLSALLAATLAGCRQSPRAVISEAEARALYDAPTVRPSGPLSVFHLGHSLVGRNMPAMVAQLAGHGHVFHSQLGWGTSLKNHWDGEINGFEVENNHDAARPATPALQNGRYDAVVLTEMVDIRSAVRYHDSATYMHRWASLAREGNPEVRLYFYESWPNTDDAEGWFERVENDLGRHWEDEILIPAVRASATPIYMIPGGQALAASIAAVLARGSVDGVSTLDQFFEVAADGDGADTIHVNDIGSYVIALTHYAVLYGSDPRGLPHQLLRADGSAALAPGETLAALIQQCVWDVVRGYRFTGVSA